MPSGDALLLRFLAAAQQQQPTQTRRTAYRIRLGYMLGAPWGGVNPREEGDKVGQVVREERK